MKFISHDSQASFLDLPRSQTGIGRSQYRTRRPEPPNLIPYLIKRLRATYEINFDQVQVMEIGRLGLLFR